MTAQARASVPDGAVLAPPDAPARPEEGSALEVLRAFARLGVSSFGGPMAHIGYFRAEFVERRRWLDERGFADLVGLCQFLPGPASSQVGFCLGLRRAGWRGGLAAWCGFTLPSALLMAGFAWGADALAASPVGAGVLHGLKLVAVAIVAQAVLGMARNLCPDRVRASIACAAAILVLGASAAVGQLGAIVLGALAGLALCRDAGTGMVPEPFRMPVTRRAGVACLALFAALLAASPLLPPVFGAFYRAGSLVFGGGHVMLPLLRDAVVPPGWVGQGDFLAGYGAAQAMPGPLSSFAAYLGALMGGPAGAAVALVGIFLGSFLLLSGTLPFWDALRGGVRAQAAMRGVNAAVVGVLGAALYDPVWTGSVQGRGDAALALLGFVLLTVWRAPPLLVVAVTALGAAALAA